MSTTVPRHDSLFRKLLPILLLAAVALAVWGGLRIWASGPYVGGPALEIEGTDLEGQPFKLSDYRGKVVVLTFWAGWCGPCMRLVPAERALVQEMQGEPFVLLGVNRDPSPEEASEVTRKRGISWRSWWDGDAAICRQWGADYLPTNYVIDHRGTIRYHNIFDKSSLLKAVDKLLKEAKEETRTSQPAS